MTLLPAPRDTERFRTLVARRFGLNFDDGKRGFLTEVLHRRIEATGRLPSAYVSHVESPEATREELRILAQELTVTETYFFRNADQFRAFKEIVLPNCMRGQAGRRSLRILSAGCASGEEAYSLAILLRDQLPDTAPSEVSILGVDINSAMLEKAARARYSSWSLRETPAEIRAHWFRAEGRDFLLDARIRPMVRFEERNLVEDDGALWRSEAFDIVFCRNVIMYFTPEIAQAVAARISRSLRPAGFLFLGHAETLRGLSQDFHLRHTHETFYYQRRDCSERPGGSIAEFDDSFAPRNTSLPEVVGLDNSWVETIRRASERIQALTTPTSLPVSASRPTIAVARVSTPRATGDLRLAIDLLRQERFSEAQAMLSALPPERADDPDVLLLRAVLLTHGGDLAEAEKVCLELLDLDEMSAGAHYLMALCREEACDHQGAVDHDQVAIYLDPGFAMPRLHLGLLARRAGNQDAARRELGQALVLLQREDGSRLLLFGGGFTREALVALSRAEMVSCGGRP